MITHKNGDLLTAQTEIIAHQVNCQGVMGSGVAKQIKEKYPIVHEKYINHCKQYSNKLFLLGFCQPIRVEEAKWIMNIFGQMNYGRDKIQYTSYEALEEAFGNMHSFAKRNNFSIAIPYNIGCGLGGGDWNIVYKIIEDIFNDDVVCEIWKL